MATQTFVSQEVKAEFLRLVDTTKAFYLNNPTSDLKTWIFLTSEGGIEQVESESEDGGVVFPEAEREFNSPVWLISILGNDAPGWSGRLDAGADELLSDLADACQLREDYFASRT